MKMLKDCDMCEDVIDLKKNLNLQRKQKMAYRAALIEACDGDKSKIAALVQKHMERLGV